MNGDWEDIKLWNFQMSATLDFIILSEIPIDIINDIDLVVEAGMGNQYELYLGMQSDIYRS